LKRDEVVLASDADAIIVGERDAPRAKHRDDPGAQRRSPLFATFFAAFFEAFFATFFATFLSAFFATFFAALGHQALEQVALVGVVAMHQGLHVSLRGGRQRRQGEVSVDPSLVRVEPGERLYGGRSDAGPEPPTTVRQRRQHELLGGRVRVRDDGMSSGPMTTGWKVLGPGPSRTGWAAQRATGALNVTTTTTAGAW
jgi:hypothetical protein